jgi:hypothetical protein
VCVERLLALTMLLLLLLSSLLLLLGCSLLTGLRGPDLCCTWPFFTSWVFFCETLLSCLGFPVVISHTSAIYDHSTPKLTEHTPSSHDRDLSRPVRVREKLLLDKVIFLCLRGDNLEEGPILVKQEVRVSVPQDSGTLSRQHEQLLSAIRHVKRSAFIFPAIAKMPRLHDFLVALLIILARNIFVALRRKLVSCMVAYRWQRLDHRLGRCRFRRCR